MNRRTFLQHTSRALAAASLYPAAASAAGAAAAQAAADAAKQAIPAAVLDRIGITTVCFRERFPATRSKGAAAPAEGELTLLTAPKMIADQLGLHNVEVWSAHFADTSVDYCREVKAAAADAGCRIIDVQVDGSDNLSDPDATKRAASIAMLKQWMDRAAAVGSPRMRANTGGGNAAAWDVNRTADSFRQLADYGKGIGVRLLIENHTGYSADIDKVVQLVTTVNHPNCKVVSDWGNTPSSSPEDRVAGLSKLLPHIDLVSAKQLEFDDQNRHVSYDIVPLIKATEVSGYRGIYSIEFYSNRPPKDVVGAARDMMKTIAANIARS